MKKAFYAPLAFRLFTLRKSLRLTQREVAVLVGHAAAGNNVISLYESGKRVPSLDTLVKLASVLQTTPAALFKDLTLEPTPLDVDTRFRLRQAVKSAARKKTPPPLGTPS